MFLNSDIVQDYLTKESSFVVPLRSFYYANRSPCISSPVMQSCVDIPTSKTIHYMRALGKLIRKQSEIKQELENCDRDQRKQETNNQG